MFGFGWFGTIILILIISAAILLNYYIYKYKRKKKTIAKKHLENTRVLVANYLNANNIEFEINSEFSFMDIKDVDEQIYKVTYNGKIYKVKVENEEIIKFVELPTNSDMSVSRKGAL